MDEKMENIVEAAAEVRQKVKKKGIPAGEDNGPCNWLSCAGFNWSTY